MTQPISTTNSAAHVTSTAPVGRPAEIGDIEPLDFLVVAPHPDDAELGFGGTIIRMLQRGMRVGVLDLTSGEPTPHGSLEIRAAETAAATSVMQLTWRGNAGLPNRSLQHTLPGRELIASYFRMLRPRWIFAPYWQDAHPDHVAATEMIEAARFWSKLSKTEMPGERYHPERLYYYYCIHLRLAVQPSVIIDISEQWQLKRDAVAAYQSQFVTGRSVSESADQPAPFLDQIEHEAAYWGKLIGRKYGEPMATREPLALDSLRDLF